MWVLGNLPPWERLAAAFALWVQGYEDGTIPIGFFSRIFVLKSPYSRGLTTQGGRGAATVGSEGWIAGLISSPSERQALELEI